jgi:signal transduction histidine kinase
MTERIAARRRLQQTNRELDAFVSTVSHDLRSPLTPLIGFADLLEERYGDRLDDIGHECLKEIKKTAEKMKNLLEDLLSLSRVGQLKEPEEPLDATTIAEDVLLELADKVLEHRAKVTIETLPAVRVAEPLLTDLFRNLLGNALKYAAPVNPEIEVKGRSFKDRNRYLVCDHGPGIERDERDDIFEPFRRGKNCQGIAGTGIGLATVAKIARVYGGSAWVEETPGGGATFIVDFPKRKF